MSLALPGLITPYVASPLDPHPEAAPKRAPAPRPKPTTMPDGTPIKEAAAKFERYREAQRRAAYPGLEP